MPFPTGEQRSIMVHREGPLVVVAGPGTGKTRTLVERMIALLQEDPSRNVSFLTFTRASRRDTLKKIEQTLGTAVRETSEPGPVRVSTLHGYAKSLVHRHAARIARRPDFSVLTEQKGERRLVLTELISDLGLSIDVQRLNKGLVCYRSTNEWPDGFPAEGAESRQILDGFERLLGLYNTFDAEGLVIAACRILREYPEALPALYLQVDEYQDLNPNDQDLVRLAASHAGSEVVVVGDDAQSIYGFRHADYHGIRTLWESGDWEHVSLADCHRLPGHIQNAAHALIAGEEYLGVMMPGRVEGATRIRTFQCTKSELQLELIAGLIQKIRREGEKRDGGDLSYSDFMVLCPTSGLVSTAAQTLEDRFGIAIKRKVKPEIPEDHWRVLLVLRMLRGQDGLALRQWLTVCGVTEADIAEIRREATESAATFYEYCRRIGEDKIRSIFKALDCLKNVMHDVNHFRQVLAEFPRLLTQQEFFPEVGTTIDEAIEEGHTPASFMRFIYEKFGLIESEGEIPEDDKVLVTTLHSAKGLEAEYVFLTWMNSRYMPMPGRDRAEEKRVLYVCLTRPKQDVILTFHETYVANQGRLGEAAMSPFLHEIRGYLDLKRIRAQDIR